MASSYSNKAIDLVEKFASRALRAEDKDFKIDDAALEKHLIGCNPCVLRSPAESDLCPSRAEAKSIAVLEEWLHHTETLLDYGKSGTDYALPTSDMATLLLRQSTLLCSLHRFDEARAAAEKAMAIDESSLALFRLACAEYCMGNFQNAVELLTRADEIDQGNSRIIFALRSALYRVSSRYDRTSLLTEFEKKPH